MRTNNTAMIKVIAISDNGVIFNYNLRMQRIVVSENNIFANLAVRTDNNIFANFGSG